jgi:glutamyl-tRNA synthetase
MEKFSLERVNKSAAIFDQEKLLWMNGVYIRQLSIEELADRILPFLERDLDPSLLPVDRGYMLSIVPLIRERLKLLSDAPDLMSYFFQEKLDYCPEKLLQKGMDQESTRTGLGAAKDELVRTLDFRNQRLEESLRAVASSIELTPRQFFGMLRVAVTGREATPPLFEMMEVLGKDRVLSRIDAAINRLEATG